jgi:hypothetical protein
MHDMVRGDVLTPIQLFLLGGVSCGLLLIGLAKLAPSVLYRWTPSREKLLGRWRTEMALTGVAIFLGTGISLLLVLALGGAG